MCARGHVCKCHGVHVEVKEHPRGARTLLLPCEYWPLDSGGQLSSKFLLPLSNRAGPSFFSVILLMSRYTVLCYRLKSLREDSMCSMTGPAHVPSPVPSSTVTSQRQKNGDIGHQQTGTVCLSPAHVTWEPRHLPCSALVWEQWFCGPELCQLLLVPRLGYELMAIKIRLTRQFYALQSNTGLRSSRNFPEQSCHCSKSWVSNSLGYKLLLMDRTLTEIRKIIFCPILWEFSPGICVWQGVELLSS